jgi:hypothetical protein
MKGVLIAAFKSKYYGFFAFNLLLSIKENSKLPVCLVADDSALKNLSRQQLNGFDKVVKIETPTQPAKVKLYLEQFTPYEETYYIDADSIVFGDFDKHKKFYVECQGYGKKGVEFPEMLWASMHDLHDHFGLDESLKIPAINSSFMFFTEDDFKIFRTAQRLFEGNPYDMRNAPQKWGRNINQPDELYLNVSLALNNYNLTKETPVHYPLKGTGAKHLIQLKEENKSILSFAGDGMNILPRGKEIYDRLMKQYCKNNGIAHIYKCNMLTNEKFIKKN